MDLITQNLLEAFRTQESLKTELPIDLLFEHFVNYCVVANEYGDEFDIDDIHTGGGGDLGLDGIAIIINGSLITDKSEVQDLLDTNKFIKAEFVFCQAKTASSFSGTDISNEFFGIRDLFSTSPKLPQNKIVTERVKIIKEVYAKSAYFRGVNPTVKVYYVTTGKWMNDTALLARVDNEIKTLNELDIFSDVSFIPKDARGIQSLFNSAKNSLTRTITFSGKVTLPILPGVKESYLGFLPAEDYLQLITDDSGNLIRGLFYDNVRDFQGDNPVNMEIDHTIKSGNRELFVLLNNGVTLVAERLSKTGDQFTIEDYQIVNGCQTSHVLFNNRALIGTAIHIPVKLIVSDDTDVKNQIIKATNRQTPVKTEELTALTDFQRLLEDYYNATKGDNKLHYERRSQQYRSMPDIDRMRIVSISSQIRAFSSAFLGLAHQASRYYGTLLKEIQGKIFVAAHPPSAYYLSSLSLFRLELILRKGLIDSKYRPFKYHLLSILRMQMMGVRHDLMSSNKFERSCRLCIDKIDSESKAEALLQAAARILDQVLSGNYDRDGAKDAGLNEKFEQLVLQDPTAR